MNGEREITLSEAGIKNLEEEFPIGRVFFINETRGMTEQWTIEGYEPRPGGSAIRVRKTQTSKFTYRRAGALPKSRQQRIDESVVEMTADELRQAIKDKLTLSSKT